RERLGHLELHWNHNRAFTVYVAKLSTGISDHGHAFAEPDSSDIAELGLYHHFANLVHETDPIMIKSCQAQSFRERRGHYVFWLDRKLTRLVDKATIEIYTHGR